MYKYHIKFIAPKARRWMFLTPKGGGTYLRIHASMFEEQHLERCFDIVKDIEESNEGYHAKVVLIDDGSEVKASKKTREHVA